LSNEQISYCIYSEITTAKVLYHLSIKVMLEPTIIAAENSASSNLIDKETTKNFLL
jgi:hypothetical protein